MPFRLILMSSFFFRFRTSPRIEATTWPMTVAMAAPATPSFGAPSRPKIRIGSKMILMMAPVACEIMEYTVRPVDCSIRSNVIWNCRPMQQQSTMLRYVEPYVLTTGLAVWLAIKGFAAKIPSSTKMIKLKIVSRMPILAALSARSNCFSPKDLDSSAFMPTPVPEPTAIIIICSG